MSTDRTGARRPDFICIFTWRWPESTWSASTSRVGGAKAMGWAGDCKNILELPGKILANDSLCTGPGRNCEVQASGFSSKLVHSYFPVSASATYKMLSNLGWATSNRETAKPLMKKTIPAAINNPGRNHGEGMAF